MRRVQVIISRGFAVLLVLVLMLAVLPKEAYGYSVLTHQAIIDAVWKDNLKPLLLKRYPGLTDEQLKEAHAYAYGGSIIQDMGYYPFSNKLFTDLAHYVRSGDFIENMISEAQDINEYAFALGALAHYAADNSGHPLAINRAVPILYPKLQKKYGDKVTYAENPTAHIRMEFGFDVVQVAIGNYAPESYRDFIGFKVSKPILEKAIKKTYGMEFKEIFANDDLAFSTYRYSVSQVIPYMTRVAWTTKKDEIIKALPGMTREKFIYAYNRRDYEKQYGKTYIKANFLHKTVAFFIRILPKVGPLKALAFKTPNAETQKLFVDSLNLTIARYKNLLNDVDNGNLDLVNRDFDTGETVKMGDYELCDKAYAKLLETLSKRDFKDVSAELKENILKYFNDLNGPCTLKEDHKKWDRLVLQLDGLRAYQVQPTTENLATPALH